MFVACGIGSVMKDEVAAKRDFDPGLTFDVYEVFLSVNGSSSRYREGLCKF